ncbi:MAG: fluoride efflux transporter CrcB [Acidobacteriota bacterium]|nr:MAG: fluoride efflux transporter CrcB [Acidobacteriota bacterium]
MELAIRLCFIGIGGAFGAIARHLINISPLAGHFEKFPLPTFIINITGSMLLGFLMIVLSDKIVVSENLRMAIIVGFLGAFTTFSTFEAEIFGLLRERLWSLTLLYMSASVVVGFFGLLVGVWLGRKI